MAGLPIFGMLGDPIADGVDVLGRSHPERDQRVNLGENGFVQGSRALRAQGDAQAADSAATHDVLGGPKETLDSCWCALTAYL